MAKLSKSESDLKKDLIKLLSDIPKEFSEFASYIEQKQEALCKIGAKLNPEESTAFENNLNRWF